MIVLILLLYQILLAPAGLVAVVYLLLFRRGEFIERLGGGTKAEVGGRVWIHAASLGEFEAARGIIEELREPGDGARIVVSCTNATALRRGAERIPPGARIRLAPIDLWPFVVRALARERPSRLIFLETEIWPAWILAASRRGVPVAFASARISRRSYRGYAAIRPLLKPVLRKVDVIGCRTEADRTRWIAIGARPERCVVWGNAKYDAGDRRPDRIRDRAGTFLLAAGSVRKGEERVLDAFALLRDRAAGPSTGDRSPLPIRLLLAPRHLREIAHWESACIRRGLGNRRLSLSGIDPARMAEDRLAVLLRDGGGGIPPDLPEVLILDRLGMLTRIYRVSDAAFIGGTWIPLGGHNLFEPAREGIPVLFGPSTEGVRDVADALVARGGGIEVSGPGALASAVERWMDSPEDLASASRAARDAAESVAGARERTLAGLRSAGFLDPQPGIAGPADRG